MLRQSRVHGPRPLKELGQHFLIDEEIASDIIKAMQLKWEDQTLEIGPGRGVLLRFILKKTHKVTAIEIDRRLQKQIEKTFGGHPGLEIIFGDFLQFDLLGFFEAAESRVKVVGNIPYNLSGPILKKLLKIAWELQQKSHNSMHSATLMLQGEVAERVCASPGGRSNGWMTVFRSLVADAELLFSVPATAFMPPPKVTSAVIQLKFFQKPKFALTKIDLFIDLIQHVFRQRRKMLKNSIKGLSWMREDRNHIDFDLTRRPEELSVEEFINLFNILYDNY